MSFTDIEINGMQGNIGKLMFVLVKENVKINKKFPGTYSMITGNTKNVYIPVTCTNTENIGRIENKWLKYLENNKEYTALNIYLKF